MDEGSFPLLFPPTALRWAEKAAAGIACGAQNAEGRWRERGGGNPALFLHQELHIVALPALNYRGTAAPPGPGKLDQRN